MLLPCFTFQTIYVMSSNVRARHLDASILDTRAIKVTFFFDYFIFSHLPPPSSPFSCACCDNREFQHSLYCNAHQFCQIVLQMTAALCKKKKCNISFLNVFFFFILCLFIQTVLSTHIHSLSHLLPHYYIELIKKKAIFYQVTLFILFNDILLSIYLHIIYSHYIYIFSIQSHIYVL